jgi:hypothetical protein
VAEYRAISAVVVQDLGPVAAIQFHICRDQWSDQWSDPTTGSTVWNLSRGFRIMSGYLHASQEEKPCRPPVF